MDLAAQGFAGEVGPTVESFLADVAADLPGVRIDRGMEARRYCSTDFSEVDLEVSAAVLRPCNTAEVAPLVELANRRGVKLAVRGGGMSYTLGYVPSMAETVTIDMRGLDRIAVNAEDGYVTAEAGATWQSVYEALRPHGLRLAFFGTWSGKAATVGGGLGNNAVGHGRGGIDDILLGLEVVLPDGRVITTGACATGAQGPTQRNYGPDLTGLFIADAGVFGIRTKATFRCERAPGGTAFRFFGLRSESELIDAMIACERLGIASQISGFGAYHHRVFSEQPTPPRAEMMAMLSTVFRGASSRWRGALDVLALVRAGRLRFLKRWPFSMTVVIDQPDQVMADRGARVLTQIARRAGAVALPPAIGILLRADPFMPIDKLIVGVDGECSFPSNATVSFSRAHATVAAIRSYFEENEAPMRAHGLTATRIYIALRGKFGIEPIIFWRDRMNPLRMSVLAPERRASVGAAAPDPDARKAAIALRRGLVRVMQEHDPSHAQIGKYYPYVEALNRPENAELLRSIKRLLDPRDVLNPGGLFSSLSVRGEQADPSH